MYVTGVGFYFGLLEIDLWKHRKKIFISKQTYLHIPVTDILKCYEVLFFTNCKGLGFFLSLKNSHYAYIPPYMHKIVPTLGNKIEQ